ncbi:unnamed protein product [Spirodela intermedia]|uniref:Tyrosinase copper-binding domain-containing protein n=1 Tax=Spirodela intermedia TaxID=51605 RepID=A0A7I8JAS3_SPIIN|nr:unnamed protein product [Spirodela intermedia]CAA6667267.1 unnamed protein product [Spirodela intermedia]
MGGMSQLISPTLSSPASPACPFQRRRRSQASAPRRPRATRPAVISCESGPSERVDRREVLLGLGGMCAAGGLGVGRRGDALALPIQAPNLSECQTAGTSSGNNCCPPYSATILDYKFTPTGKLRVRRPAHKVDEAYLAKYKKAVELMKALPADDPRSFAQQANVHCAYCDGAYDQVGFPDLELQVHNSWLFFPFHRFYLHFHERILGKLIGDDSFALPFWNWDAPAGMTIPQIFTDPSSSLYDPLRDPAHQPPEVLDMDLGDAAPTPQRQIDLNLSIMYRQMRRGGSMENSPHGPVHVWVGDPRQPNGENMGIFYSAGRDPIFYSHHANVDRMWQVWKKLNPRNVDFTDQDWLDSSFLFYDEDARLVRVKVRDCLDPEMLGFTYQKVDLPWLSKRATPRATPAGESSSTSSSPPDFPLTLSSLASITLKRPKVSRPQADKDKQEETLVVDGIEFDPTNCVKFDVYVDDTDAGEVKPDDSEFAGSFFNVPHGRGNKKKGKMEAMTTTLRLGITDLLEDLKLDDDDEILVTLIPRRGKGKVKIGGVRIELSS